MKKFFQKLNSYFRRYSNLSRKVNDALSFKESSLVTLFSLLLTLFLFSMPFLLVVNLASIIHLKSLWAILFIILITAFPWVFQYTYYHIISDKYEKIKTLNTKFLFIFESTVISLFLFLLSVMVAIFI